MHILYLALDPGIRLGSSKGSAIHVEAITRALVERGHRVSILGTAVENERASSCPVEAVPLPMEHRRTVRTLRDILGRNGTAARLDRDLRSFLYGAGTGRKVRDRIRSWKVDIVLERLCLFGISGLEAARTAGIPHALEMNAPLAEEAERYRALSLAPLAKEFERGVLHGTDRIFPVSGPLADRCRRLGVDREKIRIVPNGVDLDRFRPRGRRDETRRDLRLDPAHRVVGMVSGLRPWHGGRQLVRAFLGIARSDPDARLLVVGEGPDEQPMRETLAGAGLLSRARFPGRVSHDRVPDLIEAMDVAVAPYTSAADFYFSPLKLYEYLAMGKAVVATRMGQIEGVLRGGTAGVLVPPGDPAALQEGVLALLRAPERRSRLGERARRAARASHSWGDAARRIDESLREVLAGGIGSRHGMIPPDAGLRVLHSTPANGGVATGRGPEPPASVRRIPPKGRIP